MDIKNLILLLIVITFIVIYQLNYNLENFVIDDSIITDKLSNQHILTKLNKISFDNNNNLKIGNCIIGNSGFIDINGYIFQTNISGNKFLYLQSKTNDITNDIMIFGTDQDVFINAIGKSITTFNEEITKQKNDILIRESLVEIRETQHGGRKLRSGDNARGYFYNYDQNRTKMMLVNPTNP